MEIKLFEFDFCKTFVTFESMSAVLKLRMTLSICCFVRPLAAEFKWASNNCGANGEIAMLFVLSIF
jgi:hypothetical protein